MVVGGKTGQNFQSVLVVSGVPLEDDPYGVEVPGAEVEGAEVTGSDGRRNRVFGTVLTGPNSGVPTVTPPTVCREVFRRRNKGRTNDSNCIHLRGFGS